jgi:hypothetical protein
MPKFVNREPDLLYKPEINEVNYGERGL